MGKYNSVQLCVIPSQVVELDLRLIVASETSMLIYGNIYTLHQGQRKAF
jgi:hypothetical protein